MTEDQEKSNWEILYGGADLIVRVIDNKEIKPVQVKVRKVGLKDLGKLAGSLGDQLVEARLYVEQPEEWFVALPVEELFGIIAEGRRLNEKSLTAWFDLQKKNGALMGVDVNALMGQAVESALLKSSST